MTNLSTKRGLPGRLVLANQSCLKLDSQPTAFTCICKGEVKRKPVIFNPSEGRWIEQWIPMNPDLGIGMWWVTICLANCISYYGFPSISPTFLSFYKKVVVPHTHSSKASPEIVKIVDSIQTITIPTSEFTKWFMLLAENGSNYQH